MNAKRTAAGPLYLFAATLLCGGLILLLQVPFAYYSADNVYHVARILACKSGDYFSDPITGFASAYPPLFHIIFGLIARILGLTGFGVGRLIQLVNFLGLFLAGFVFLRSSLRNKNIAAFGSLVLVLLIYAPTGKYIFYQNPSNFAQPFVLLGGACLISFYEQRRRQQLFFAAAFLAFAVDLWLWNILPVCGLALGLLIVLSKEHTLRQFWKPFVIAVLLFIAFTSFLPLFFFSRSEMLSYYGLDAQTYTYAESHSILEVIGTWLLTFLLKGNQPFLKHLFPATIGSESFIVIVYGIVGAIYFYLLVLPVNYLLIFSSLRRSLQGEASTEREPFKLLSIAAIFVFFSSFLLLFRGDPAVTRRAQFFVFIFLLPGFLAFISFRLKLAKYPRRSFLLGLLPALAMVYTTIYTFSPALSDPLPSTTEEVVDYISNTIDDDQRIFVTQYDLLTLARYAHFKSFWLYGKYSYFKQEKGAARSIKEAYDTIIDLKPGWRHALHAFNTGYIIISKRSISQSPVLTKETPNIEGEKLISRFRDQFPVVLENEDWIVFTVRD